MEEVIDKILDFINTPDVIVGHNIEFDEAMLKVELKRLQREHDYKPKDTYCSMKNTVNFCAIM
jgi:DNA polymerase III epsilon subunit-like protein